MKTKPLLAFLLLSLLGLVPAQAAYPSPVGRVNDFAQVLTEPKAKALAAEITAFEEKTRHQLAVVTVPSLEGQSIEAFTLGLARQWGVGRAEANDGVVLLVAPRERKMRIEVGRGLHDALPDAECQRILDGVMRPLFKQNRMEEGIIAGTRAILSRLTPPPVLTPEEQMEALRVRVATAKARAEQERLADEELDRRLTIAGLCLVIALIVVVIARYVFVCLDRRREFADRLAYCEDAIATTEKAIEDSRSHLGRLHEVCSETTAARLAAVLRESESNLFRVRAKAAVIVRAFSPWGPRATDSIIQLGEVWREIGEIEGKARMPAQAYTTGIVAKQTAQAAVAELPGLLKEAAGHLTDERVDKHTQGQLREAIAAGKAAPSSAGVTDWRIYEGSITPIRKLLTRACEKARSEIDTYQRAPAECARLLKEMSAAIKKLEEKAGRSSKAREALSEAQRNFSRAATTYNTSSGLSGTEWVLLYMFLMNNSSAVEKATASAIAENTRRYNDDSRSSSSSADYGSNSFGGGGFSGGGASSDW